VFKTFLYIILIIILLRHPDLAFNYAYQGLYNWATRIVPTLFPFMMISSLMVYSGADLELGKLLGKFFKRIYRFSNYGLYAIFMGFFCGFPMGAKVVSNLYEQGKIGKSEANTLLSFCNNIGPAYFTGIIIPIIHALGYSNIFPFIFGMYGIPALYGIIIGIITVKHDKTKTDLYKSENPESASTDSLISIIKKSCTENTQAIIILGGYITFTNAIKILLDLIPITKLYNNIISAFIELTGGVQTIYLTDISPQSKLICIMVALSFGGISCFMQTSSFLEKSGLSIKGYLKHKIITTFISTIYYLMVMKLPW
jgi:sporulation integral membrane protein YlbJ